MSTRHSTKRKATQPKAALRIRMCSAVREAALAWEMRAEYVKDTPEWMTESATALRDVADALEAGSYDLNRTSDGLHEAVYLATAAVLDAEGDDLSGRRGQVARDALGDLTRLRATLLETMDPYPVTVTKIVRDTYLDPAARAALVGGEDEGNTEADNEAAAPAAGLYAS